MEDKIRLIVKEQVAQILKEYNFNDDDSNIPDEYQDFDSFEFNTSAKDAAKKDIESSGQKFTDIGKNKFEKGLTKDKFVSDLEKANLKLPSDSKEMDKIQSKLDDRKKKKDSMFGASLNEDERKGDYMTIQNLKNIEDEIHFLNSVIKDGDDVEDWIEDKVSKMSENMKTIVAYYKAKM